MSQPLFFLNLHLSILNADVMSAVRNFYGIAIPVLPIRPAIQ